MAKPSVNPDLCTGCGICMEECAAQALEIKDDVVQLARPDECTECGNCKENCPSEAIMMK
jgi:NAD-dependent dihydropyrimidine dehydrogenase PreA subunit